MVSNHKYVRIVVSKYTYVCMILRYIISQCILYIYMYIRISKTLGTSYIRQYQYPDFWLVGSACSVGKEHVSLLYDVASPCLKGMSLCLAPSRFFPKNFNHFLLIPGRMFNV